MELWTKEHFMQLIPCEIAMIIIAIILNKLIGKKSYKVRMIPFQVLAVVLFISEIIKQYLSIKRGYDLYHIPLHVCSLFIFLIPLMAFYKGKYASVVRTVTCTVTTAMVLFMVIYPNLIYGAGNIINFFKDYFDFHTVFFHNIVIFEFILIIALRLHDTGEKSNPKPVFVFATCYSIVAATMSQILETNFSNFYSCNIGPIASVVDSIKEAIGYVGAQTIYVVVLAILHVAFFVGSYYLYYAINKLNVKLRGRIE